MVFIRVVEPMVRMRLRVGGNGGIVVLEMIMKLKLK